MLELSLFDFDGTLVRGDSTRLAFRCIHNNKIRYLWAYYFRVLIRLFIARLTGNYDVVKETRRRYLVERLDVLKSSNFRRAAYNEIFSSVYNEVVELTQKGVKVVIVSAGYREIIALVLGNDFEYELIANSLFEVRPTEINFENKVTMVNARYTGYFVKSAYGNSEGDIPMLHLAEKAFWVDGKGKISELIQ